MPHHITEKTEGQGENTGNMTDNLNGEHNRNHPPYRPQEMLDIAWTMIQETDNMGKNNNHHRTGKRRVQAGGRRIKARNQADQVAPENINEYGCSQGQEPPPLFSGNCYHKLFDAGNDNFQQILHSARNHAHGLDRHVTENNKQNHYHP